MAALLKSGKKVLIPIGENSRYDLVVDDGGKFLRVQCKSGRLREGVVKFNACSSGNARKPVRKDYAGEAELFGVYCADNDTVYLVPVTSVCRTEAHLRIEPALPNRNKHGSIKWAKDFQLGV